MSQRPIMAQGLRVAAFDLQGPCPAGTLQVQAPRCIHGPSCQDLRALPRHCSRGDALGSLLRYSYPLRGFVDHLQPTSHTSFPRPCTRAVLDVPPLASTPDRALEKELADYTLSRVAQSTDTAGPRTTDIPSLGGRENLPADGASPTDSESLQVDEIRPPRGETAGAVS